MSVEKATQLFAGIMVLLSVILTTYVSANFVWFTVFIGANLAQSSLSGFCPASIFFNRVLGLKKERELG